MIWTRTTFRSFVYCVWSMGACAPIDQTLRFRGFGQLCADVFLGGCRPPDPPQPGGSAPRPPGGPRDPGPHAWDKPSKTSQKVQVNIGARVQNQQKIAYFHIKNTPFFARKHNFFDRKKLTFQDHGKNGPNPTFHIHFQIHF